MTRESKVAIILGFAVVLVVAALISDHFSHARQARLDNTIALGTPKEFGAVPVGLTEPIGNTKPKDLPIRETPNGQGPGRAQGTPQGDNPAAKPNGAKPDGAKPGSAVEGDQPSPYPGNDSSEAPERAIAQDDLPISEKKATPYKVKENDSLYRIASTNYGDGTLWPELAEYNKDKVGANNALKVGTTITIPPKDVLLGKARLRPEGTPVSGAKNERRVAINDERPIGPVTPPEKTPKFTSYTIRKGDHLSTIAQRLLGSSQRMGEILKLNPNLDDEDSIREGVVIKIPRN